MTSKLIWATAMILIVAVAGVGVWAILGGAPAEVTPAPAWSSYVFAWPPDNSGIENIYFMENAKTYNPATNLSGHENIIKYLGTPVVATRTSLNPDIPYDNRFQIVVAISAFKPPIGNLAKENVKVEFAMSGNITLTAENSLDTKESIFATGANYIRLNAVWDNGGAGYVLPAGGNFTYTVKLWVWG